MAFAFLALFYVYNLITGVYLLMGLKGASRGTKWGNGGQAGNEGLPDDGFHLSSNDLLLLLVCLLVYLLTVVYALSLFACLFSARVPGVCCFVSLTVV